MIKSRLVLFIHSFIHSFIRSRNLQTKKPDFSKTDGLDDLIEELLPRRRLLNDKLENLFSFFLSCMWYINHHECKKWLKYVVLTCWMANSNSASTVVTRTVTALGILSGGKTMTYMSCHVRSLLLTVEWQTSSVSISVIVQSEVSKRWLQLHQVVFFH